MALVLVMGIPGAGKTTLCKELKRQFGDVCATFSFDDIFDDDGFMEHLWGKKHASGSMLRLYGLDGGSSAHHERKRYESKVREFMKTRESNGESALLYVVDDIFYLKSMRRPFRRMANSFHLTYIVVLVDVPLEVALAQNAGRSERYCISETVIMKICKQMELPVEDQNCFIYRPGENLVKLVEYIRARWETNPRILSKDLKKNETTKTSSKEKWKKLELDLRKCVGNLIKERDGSKEGALLSKIKKALYCEMRSKDVTEWDTEGLKDILRQRLQVH